MKRTIKNLLLTLTISIIPLSAIACINEGGDPTDCAAACGDDYNCFIGSMNHENNIPAVDATSVKHKSNTHQNAYYEK